MEQLTSELHVVNVNWNADNRSWNVNCNPWNQDNVWNQDNRVFATRSILL